MEVPEGVTLNYLGRKYTSGMEVPKELEDKVKGIKNNYTDKKKTADKGRDDAEEKLKKDRLKNQAAATKAANEKAKDTEKDGESKAPVSGSSSSTGSPSRITPGAGSS